MDSTKDINFNEWKALALKGRSKRLGRLLSHEYRLHYDKEDDTVTLWERNIGHEFDDKAIIYSHWQLFTINNKSELTFYAENQLSYQSFKMLVQKYFGISITKLPAYDIYHYDALITSKITYGDQIHIYVPGNITLNAKKEFIKAGDYIYRTIEYNFQNKLKKLSRAFREQLNIAGNMLNLNGTITEITTKAIKQDPDAYSNGVYNLPAVEIYQDMLKPMVDKQLFKKWQRACVKRISPYAFLSHAITNNTPVDVRKTAQRIIRDSYYDIARLQNKLVIHRIQQPCQTT